jgi:hypothetical protein
MAHGEVLRLHDHQYALRLVTVSGTKSGAPISAVMMPIGKIAPGMIDLEATEARGGGRAPSNGEAGRKPRWSSPIGMRAVRGATRPRAKSWDSASSLALHALAPYARTRWRHEANTQHSCCVAVSWAVVRQTAIASAGIFCMDANRGDRLVVRYRLIVSVIAVLGVLLHAGLLVRHGGMMVQAQLTHQELASALGVICHGDGTTSQTPSSDLPAPSNSSSDCPLCMGMMTTATLPEQAVVAFISNALSERIVTVAERIAPRLAAVCPPSRGPPAIV